VLCEPFFQNRYAALGELGGKQIRTSFIEPEFLGKGSTIGGCHGVEFVDSGIEEVERDQADPLGKILGLYFFQLGRCRTEPDLLVRLLPIGPVLERVVLTGH